MTLDKLIELVAEAIARENGFYKKGGRVPSVSQRLNNPGCLEHWKDPSGHQMPEVNGLVEFESSDEGFRALRAQCRIVIAKRGLTFYEIFAGRLGVYRGLMPMRQDGITNPMAYATKVVQFINRTAGTTAETSTVALDLTNPLAKRSQGLREAA